jgi:putative hydrolase of the HAD superfamily
MGPQRAYIGAQPRLGGLAAYVPYHITWEHEKLDALPTAPGRFFTLTSLRELPALVARLATEM